MFTDSAYVSRVFPLGPGEATDATDAWLRCLPSTPSRRRLVAGRRLRVRPTLLRTDFDPLLLRSLRGTLWVGGWWPVRMELELACYSRFASEVALRPVSVRWPVGIESYEKDAAVALEEIATAITTGVKNTAHRSSERKVDATFMPDRVLWPTPRNIIDYVAPR
jgi:hypothetical protein